MGAVLSNQERKMSEKELISLTIDKKELKILLDSVGVHVALLTEEYQNKPSLEKAVRMDAAVNLHEKLKRRR
jgi:ribosomal protein L25 (general stress protein Ctc)